LTGPGKTSRCKLSGGERSRGGVGFINWCVGVWGGTCGIRPWVKGRRKRLVTPTLKGGIIMYGNEKAADGKKTSNIKGKGQLGGNSWLTGRKRGGSPLGALRET